MVDLLTVPRYTSETDNGGTFAPPMVVQNGEISSDENDEIENETAPEMNRNEAAEQPPNKKLKVKMPAFLTPKSNVDWKPLPNENPKRATRLGVESICPEICFNFLRDECVEGDNCYDMHEFASNADVTTKLNECGPAQVAKLFHVIVARNPKLLHRYFQVFIDFFTERQMKDDVIDAVNICERETNKNKRTEFLQYLIQAIIRCGVSYKMAMTKIYFQLDKRYGDTVTTLLDTNLVDGISVDDFLSVFRTLNEHRFRYTEQIVNRLMYLCIESENALNFAKLDQFVQIIFNILKRNGHVKALLDKNSYNSFFELCIRLRQMRKMH